MSLPMIISVRGYAVPERDIDLVPPPNQGRKRPKNLARPSDWCLVFDCETTIDQGQSLRFGTYQCRKKRELVEQGIFYEPDNPKGLSKKDIATLRDYARERCLSLLTRDEFVHDVFYKYAYHYGALVIGFNLPFDIGCLAIRTSTSHARDMRNAFSITLSNEKNLPNVLIKHLNAKTSFMRFASAGALAGRSMRKRGEKFPVRRGYFQDVKTLAAAQLGKSHTLKSLAEVLETEHRKSVADAHGAALTTEYIDYAMNDTQVTWECYEKLLAMYAQHGLEQMPAHRIYSEASLGKAYLAHMGIQPPRKVYRDIPPDLIGLIMGAYYGGRAEVRIRRQIARVLYCDFRSMYPTACTLMGLWDFVTARGYDWTDWTEEARKLLSSVTLADLQKKAFWKTLPVLVQIIPQDDVLPVRAAYDGQSRTIGLNYLLAHFPLCYTLADCIASKLVTGSAPWVVKAWKFTPREPQEGLTAIKLGGDSNLTINPNETDLYREMILKRGVVQSLVAKATSPLEAERLEAQSMMLKLMANSTSYGIFAEQNVQTFDRPRPITLYGQERVFRTGSKSIEEPGSHFHPLIATLITGAARLMLMCAEQLAAQNGIGWTFCDTDSLALAKPDDMDEKEFLERCETVTAWFDGLDPYGDGKPLFKVESQNFDSGTGKPLALYALAISAKRYVLFNLEADGRPILRKALAHGLGHLLEPFDDGLAPSTIPLPPEGLPALEIKRWQHDLWYRIVEAFLDGHPDRLDLSGIHGLDLPACSRYGANTATLLNWFKQFNQGKPFHQQVKSFNFMLAFQVSPPAFAQAVAEGSLDAPWIDDGIPAVVAPFTQHRNAALKTCFDRRTGKPVPPCVLKTYREVIAEYAIHPELKFENADFYNSGLTERRHVEAVAVEYIGKESNRWEEEAHFGEVPETQVEYGISPTVKCNIVTALSRHAKALSNTKFAKKAGISRQELIAILGGNTIPRAKTIRALVGALVER